MMRSLSAPRLALLLLLVLSHGVAFGEDWPTFMHDAARSGVAAEALPFPLANLWTYAPPAAPTRAWPAANERDKMTFDDATQVALAGDAVFFGSSVDQSIHALDAATGASRWSVFTDGPVRLAPTFSQGRIYAGSDDGAVYCLQAATGQRVWVTRPKPGPTRILGAGRVMSLWPVRTDILVDNGVAYCGAGLFPTRDTTVLALDAQTGQSRWKMFNPPSATKKFVPPIPQGYLVASADHLFVPRGRAPAQILSRKDGAYLGTPAPIEGRKGVLNGDYGVIIDGLYYYGTQGTLNGFAPDGVRKASLAETRQVVATSTRQFRLAESKRATSVVAVDSTTKAVLWRSNRPDLQTLIVAGPHVIVGGANEVLALDAQTGKTVWTATVEGLVKGLAAAHGRLMVSTDNGRIHCFGAGLPASPAATSPATRPALDAFPASPATARAAALADAIAKDTGLSRGYALLIAADAAPLALEISRRSGLRVHVAEFDEAKAVAARRALAAAGAYGSHVVVDIVSPDPAKPLPYPPYFANLVVVDAPALARGPALATEALRTLKPCGGILYAATASPGAAWAKAGPIAPATLAGETGWSKLVRGSLPGAGAWTHQFADAGNTSSSDDANPMSKMDILWYGDPGPDQMQERHRGSEAPLFVDGRIYLQGLRQPGDRALLMCFDAYNGVAYWEREIPGAARLTVVANCGNLAASKAGLFVAIGRNCLHLDPATSKTLRTFAPPEVLAASAGDWAYVAVVGDTLVGSLSPANQFSRELFAFDIPTGGFKWRHSAGAIRNSTIAVAGGRVFFAEHRGATSLPHVMTYEERLQLDRDRRLGKAPPKSEPVKAAKAKADDDDHPDGEDAPPPPPEPEPLRHTAVALDLSTGKELWAREVDLSGCGSWSNNLCSASKHDVLVFYGSYNAYGRPGENDDKRRALALSAKDGSLLWNQAIGNVVRPVLVNDWLVARPKAVHLKTGQPVMVADPRSQPWSAARAGACGQMSASASTLFYRNGGVGMLDVGTGRSSGNFLGIRPGCLINIIPAGGLVAIPEASSGCVCAHAALQCTVVLVPFGAE
ncbi:MAG: PQQ-binding-like beta-propeller repeat protein [Planctomycetota bacterium]|nr:PQQ-binding-like beta-propeller repeat protein [Planctomycetota bacterium]